jgi:hypothetical protein
MDVERLERAMERAMAAVDDEWTIPEFAELTTAEYAAIANEVDHKPGEPHEYSVTCMVCGQNGTVRLSIEPQYEGSVALAALQANTAEPGAEK